MEKNGFFFAGDLYHEIDGKMCEIKRQMRQKSGYPYDPQGLNDALQLVVEGKFEQLSSGLAVPETVVVPTIVSQKIFMITLPGDKKTSELIKFGRYDWVNDVIMDKRFPIASHASQTRRIEYVEFDHDPTSEEVLAEFSRLGLTRPVPEDALAFGIEHPEEQRKRPVVFFHEPVQDAFGYRGVLVLFGVDGGRRLGLGDFGSRWPRYDVFAGVREPQQ